MSVISFLTLCLYFVQLVSPWTIDVHPDLAYPPRWTAAPGDRYMSKNGTFLSPNYLDSCLNQRVPQNATRSKFHVSAGRAIFDLVNATEGNPTNESFTIESYLPQLYYNYPDNNDGSEYNEGVKGTYKSKQNMWRYFYWQNFPKKGRCYLPMNMTQMIVDKAGNALQPSELVGLNATLMFAVEDGRNYRVFEEVDQCAYVTLTDEDVQPVEDIGPCDGYNPLSALASPSPSPSSKSAGVRIERGWTFVLMEVIALALYGLSISR